MRAQLLLIPAALVMAAPASATIYMGVQDAQDLLFPGATFTEHFVKLSDAQAATVADNAHTSVYDAHVKAWRVSGKANGWVVLDQTQGKDDTITFAVAIDDNGAVQGVEILECLADYNTVTMPEWRAQFIGETTREPKHVEMISGATLSSRHITDAVRRVLFVYDEVLKNATPS